MRTLRIPTRKVGVAAHPREDRRTDSAREGPGTLRLIAVGKRFDGVAALDDVHLRLSQGEILGLIGPNGSGKTTLLGIASGVLRPSHGSVVLDSTDLTRSTPTRFAQLGVGRIFQQVRLFEGLSVEENVAVGAVAKGIDFSHVERMLEHFDLMKDRDRDATTLSYGVRRRIEIARALAGRPRFLLLDEPAAGMSETETSDLLQILDELATESHCGVLIVDHDLRLILRICDRVHVLNDGLTIAEGPPDEVREDPAVIAAYIGEESPGSS